MKYYRRNRGGSGKAKTILFRIGFVVIAALIITIATVLVGHYLRSMVEKAGGLDGETEDLGSEISREPIDTSPHTYHSETVFGCGVDLTEYESKDELEKKIIDLSAYYDTLNITVTDESGNFVYTSPVLCELLRVPSPEDNGTYELLKVAITSAKALGMRVCIVMSSSDFDDEASTMIDAAVAGEITSLGADELLFIPKLTEDDYINYNLATKIRSYFNDLRKSAKEICPLGIILPPSSYQTVSNTKQLQMIASAVSFMAIDFTPAEGESTETIYSSITESISALRDSFSTHNMRVILRGADEAALGAAYAASTHSSINNIAFTSSIFPTSLSYSSTDPEDGTESESETYAPSPEDRTNPYAEVPKSEDETESGESRPWY